MRLPGVLAVCWSGMLASAVFAAELAPVPVTLQAEDGAVLQADLYPPKVLPIAPFGVVLAHGGRYDKQSWRPQAEVLQARGITVLAFDFRGHGASRGPGDRDGFTAPLHLDVLAAARYLRKRGMHRVAVVGGSLGGMAAGDALALGRPGDIDRVVFLGARPSLAGVDLAKVTGPKLFIVARDDPEASGRPRLERIRADFERVPQPRRLVVVDGSAHAQALFATEQGPDVLEEIVEFLGEK